MEQGFLRELSTLARQGALGVQLSRGEREEEALRAWELARNGNLLIVGMPGSGKTKLVQALARDVFGGDDFAYRELWELLPAAAEHDTPVLHGIMEELQGKPESVLFIDGIRPFLNVDPSSAWYRHNLEELSEAIRNGTVRCIGTLTPDEYKAALELRPHIGTEFGVYELEEASDRETLELVEVLRPQLEARSGVTIDPTAMNAAVRLGREFLPRRAHPGKAVELLEEACGRYQSKSAVQTAEGDAFREGFDRGIIRPHEILSVVESRTGLKIRESGLAAHRHIAGQLKEFLPGQDQVVQPLATKLVNLRYGLRHPFAPAGFLVCCGGPGTESTRMALVMSELLWGSTDFVRGIDFRACSTVEATETMFRCAEGELEGPFAEMLRDGNQPLILLMSGIEHAHPLVKQRLAEFITTGEIEQQPVSELDCRHCLFVASIVHTGFDEVDTVDDPDCQALLETALGEELLARAEKAMLFTNADIAARAGV